MTALVFGAFGKIPSVGDFFRISAPNGFVPIWDDWLQKCLVAGAQTYGPRWDGLYMSAPIWRFTLAEGIAGPKRIIGVLMPSVDRVGRRFPLTLMSALDGPGSGPLDHFLNSDLFTQLEDAALASLEDEASKDTLQDALTGLYVPDTDRHVSLSRRGPSVFLQQNTGLASAPATLAAEYIAGSVPRPSVWSAEVDNDTRLMVCDGLPEGASMTGLFDLDADVWKAGQE